MSSADLTASRTAACVLNAMLILGFADNLIRILAEDIGLHQFHFMRSLLAVSGLVVFAILRKLPLRAVSAPAVIARGVLVAGAMYLYFAALAFLPISTVVAGLFTAPVFVLLINVVFFKYPLNALHVLAVIIGFAGMVLITLPAQGQVSLAHTVPIIAGLLYAVSNVVAREYCQQESTLLLSVSVFAVLGALGGLSLLSLTFLKVPLPDNAPGFITAAWQPFTQTALALTAFHALCASLAIGLLTYAYQFGASTRVAVLEYVLLIFAALFAWLLWFEVPTRNAVLGMLLISASGIMITRPR